MFWVETVSYFSTILATASRALSIPWNCSSVIVYIPFLLGSSWKSSSGDEISEKFSRLSRLNCSSALLAAASARRSSLDRSWVAPSQYQRAI
jgi:hypothetical protein